MTFQHSLIQPLHSKFTTTLTVVCLPINTNSFTCNSSDILSLVMSHFQYYKQAHFRATNSNSLLLELSSLAVATVAEMSILRHRDVDGVLWYSYLIALVYTIKFSSWSCLKSASYYLDFFLNANTANLGVTLIQGQCRWVQSQRFNTTYSKLWKTFSKFLTEEKLAQVFKIKEWKQQMNVCKLKNIRLPKFDHWNMNSCKQTGSWLCNTGTTKNQLFADILVNDKSLFEYAY